MNQCGKLIFGFVLVSIIVCSCGPKTPRDTTPVVGELDTLAVAQDTAMQHIIDNSYEYSKTLNVAEHLAFDVVGFGGTAASGEYAVIRRAEDNRPDTIFREAREGAIIGAWNTDFDKDEEPEIVIAFKYVGGNREVTLKGVEVKKSLLLPLQFDKGFDLAEYKGFDTAYYNGKELIWEFPVYKKGDTVNAAEKAKVAYGFKRGGVIFAAKTEGVSFLKVKQ